MCSSDLKRKSKKKTSLTRRKKQDDSRTCSHCGKKGHEKDKCWKLHLEKAPKSLHQRKHEKKQPIKLIVTSDESDPTLILVNKEDKDMDRERPFTLQMQVKNKVISTILDSGS